MSNAWNHLDWLIQQRLLAANRRDHDWLFAFARESKLVVECLWRLVEGKRIRLTSLDDGQQLGLPTPVDAEHEINSRLVNASVVTVTLRDTLDLQLTFDTGHILEIIPDSSGYEAWNA
ncbi:MAG: DUF6188 family protein, partial [Planctomycetota bacterium]